MSVIDVFEALESARGSNAKKSLLREELENDLLKRIFVMVFDPYTNFGIAKFKMGPGVEAEAMTLDEDEVLEGFLTMLADLAQRQTTGNAAKEWVESFFSKVPKRTQKWCKRIILQNLRVGVQATTVNKLWEGLITEFNVQLADKLRAGGDDEGNVVINDTLAYPVYADPKFDGLRCVVTKENGEVTLRKRSGQIIDTLPTIKAALEAAEIDNIFLDAEAMGNDWNESSSVIGSTKRAKDDSGMVLRVFDAMSIEDWNAKKCDVPFQRRSELAASVCLGINSRSVQHVELELINNDEELIVFYKKCLDEEHEGIMIKSLDGLYNFDGDRDSRLIKMKPVATYEGTIVNWYEGRDGTKRAGIFGGFGILLPNGVITNCGGGLVAQNETAAKIQLEGPDSYIGRIVEMEGQPPLTKEGKVRFPVIKRFRCSSDVDRKVLEAYEAYQELYVG